MKIDSFGLALIAAITIITTTMLTMSDRYQPKELTYKKSSDSEWEVSKIRMPDTTIIDTLIISGIVVNPTTQYINIKIK